MKKLFLLTLFTGLLLAGCGNKKQGTQALSEALPIEVATPTVKDITLTKDYPGYLDADATIALVGRVNGTLQSTLFNPGERVKKGQLLFIIEPTTYQDAVTQAEAALKTANASLDYARNNYERMKEAIKSDAVSRIQYLQSESNVKECEAAVSNAEAALRTARTNLDYCYVKSPCNGQISLAVYSVGTYIAGSVSPVTLATVYKDDKMYSYFNVADNQWLAQNLSQELNKPDPNLSYYVTVRLGSDGKQTWKAKVDYLSPNITLSTGTLKLRAELENPDGLLKSGSYISVTLPYGYAKDAILVNDASIGTDQLGKYLYVVNDSNKVNYRPVEVGQLVDDTLRFIKKGLLPNERYVTKALLKVRNGMLIRPIEASPQKGSREPSI